MAKIRVVHTVDVPERFIFFDLAATQFVCIGCGKREKWNLDAPATRGFAPDDKTRIKNFLVAHGKCAAAHAADPQKELVVPQGLLRGLLKAWRDWQSGKDPTNDDEGQQVYSDKAEAVAEYLDKTASQ